MARGLGGVTVMRCWEGIVWEECVTRKYSCSNKWGQGKLASGIPCWLHGQGAERSRVSCWHEECAQTIHWNQPQFLSLSPWLGTAWKPRSKQCCPLLEWADCSVWCVHCGFFLFVGRWGWDEWYPGYLHKFLPSISVGSKEQRKIRWVL